VPIERPGPGEHHAYYSQYIEDVPDGDVLQTLADQATAVARCFRRFGEHGALHRYAPGKWSVKEVLGHLNDTERLFVYRALAFARNDTSELPGMDENGWVAGAGFDRIPLSGLLDEFAAIRRATVLLFRGLSPEALVRRGVANGHPVSVRAVPWIIAGHVAHHLSVVEERYRRP
jgi:DinB superfamily